MYVILLGPPGVGKGTQGLLLADEMGWQRVATGDLLRAATAAGTPLGHEAQGYMSSGALVPDRLIIEMVKEKLTSVPAGTGVLFDGFPRTEAQASAFTMMLQALGLVIDHVVVLEADDEVLTKRISGRRSCPACGSVYNTVLDPPQREGVCDNDGTALVQVRSFGSRPRARFTVSRRSARHSGVVRCGVRSRWIPLGGRCR